MATTLAAIGLRLAATEIIDELAEAHTKALREGRDATVLLRDATAALAAGDLDVVAEFLDRALTHLAAIEATAGAGALEAGA